MNDDKCPKCGNKMVKVGKVFICKKCGTRKVRSFPVKVNISSE